MDAVPPNSRDSTPPICVLHVDDDPARVRLSSMLLGDYLPDVVVHSDTEPTEALDRLDDGLAVDCVVSDFDMGSMDGLAFLEAVRERDADVPFILFTGKGNEEIASEAISAGVTDYLQKSGSPDTYAVLAKRIENAVAQYRAERAAESYRRRMETVYERVTDAFLALDEEWEFTFVNGHAEELIDHTEAELLGKSIWDAFPNAVGTQFEEEYRTAMETQESTTFEAYFAPLDALFEVHAYPSEGGLSVFFRDVTNEDRVRKELHREKELLEQVFETSPVGILVMDTDGEIRRANDRMVELLEVTEEEVTDRTYDSSQWTITDENGEPIPDDEHPLTEVFEREVAIHDRRIGYESPSGEWSLHSVSAAPIYSQDGEFERVVFAVEDVTERGDD